MHANVFIGGGIIRRLLSRKKAKTRIYRERREKTDDSLENEFCLHIFVNWISLFLTKMKVSLDTLFLSRQMRGYQRKELNWIMDSPLKPGEFTRELTGQAVPGYG